MIRWLLEFFRDRSMDQWNAMEQAYALASARARQTCDICCGIRYECPKCHAQIAQHSHEGDYMCELHGFVHPIRCSDGVRMNGNGDVHQQELA